MPRKKENALVLVSHEELPVRLINAIKALDAEARRGIIYLLDSKGPLSFTVIYRALNISKQNAAAHLRVLSYAGLIDRKLKQDREEFTSYYELTKFASRLLKSLLDSTKSSIDEDDVTIEEGKNIAKNIEMNLWNRGALENQLLPMIHDYTPLSLNDLIDNYDSIPSNNTDIIPNSTCNYEIISSNISDTNPNSTYNFSIIQNKSVRGR
ncbi:MAG TPA: helix-turn-helix domain-containing protein [Candidatus Lokiarchaeia archaeon]|nr:helix-turn-helix domain-containing protein [Candidatus Lokiarchaeia archaeon]